MMSIKNNRKYQSHFFRYVNLSSDKSNAIKKYIRYEIPNFDLLCQSDI